MGWRHCFAEDRLYQQYRVDQQKQEEQRLITTKQQNKASFLPPLSGCVSFVPEEHGRFFAHYWWLGITRMVDFCSTGYGAVCLAGCAARRGLSGLRVGRIRRSRRIRCWLGDAH
ncbi:predicted protein [Escherichia albertii]|nr:predicted protein [Escherichia albertii]